MSKSRYSQKQHIYERKHFKPTWPLNALDKLLPRPSIFRAKLYAFLVSLVKNFPQDNLKTNEPSHPLVQKQYLVGEVGENCLIQVQSRDPIFQKSGPFVINLENLSDLN